MKTMAKTHGWHNRLAIRDEAAYITVPVTITDVNPEAAKKVPTALIPVQIAARTDPRKR